MMAFGVFSSHIKKVSLDPDNCKDRRGLGSYWAPFFSVLEPGRPDSWKIRSTLFWALELQNWDNFEKLGPL